MRSRIVLMIMKTTSMSNMEPLGALLFCPKVKPKEKNYGLVEVPLWGNKVYKKETLLGPLFYSSSYFIIQTWYVFTKVIETIVVYNVFYKRI